MPEEGLTRISEDPTILSGTLRSTLDVFDEYQDAEIVSIVDAAYSCYTQLSFLVRSTTSCPLDSIWRRGAGGGQCEYQRVPRPRLARV